MNIGLPEILLILLVLLLFFGPRKLPELGKAIGEGLREFRKATRDAAGDSGGGPASPSGRDAQNR